MVGEGGGVEEAEGLIEGLGGISGVGSSVAILVGSGYNVSVGSELALSGPVPLHPANNTRLMNILTINNDFVLIIILAQILAWAVVLSSRAKYCFFSDCFRMRVITL